MNADRCREALFEAFTEMIDERTSGMTIDADNIEGLEGRIEYVVEREVESQIEKALDDLSVHADDVEGLERVVENTLNDHDFSDFAINTEQVEGLDDFVKNVVQEHLTQTLRSGEFQDEFDKMVQQSLLRTIGKLLAGAGLTAILPAPVQPSSAQTDPIARLDSEGGFVPGAN